MKTYIMIPFFAVVAIALARVAAYAQGDAAIDRARAAFKAHDFTAASAVLEPLSAGEHPDPAACHVLSQVLLAQKDAASAVALAERATALDANKPEYFVQLGSAIAARMGQVPFLQQAMLSTKLRKAFAKAVELDPNNVAGLIGLTRFYVNAPEIAGGSLEKAGEYARRVQALDPFLGACELGGIAEKDERYADALTFYENALGLKPAPHVEYLCGRVLAKLGRPADARAHLEAALKAAPDHAGAKQALAALGPPKQ